jgi:cytochrome c-type biogenesis protein CcsB
MKRITDFLFSTRLTLVLLIIFAASLGVATFIEEKYDTITSQIVVYHSRWFEVLLVLMAVNFIGNIARFKMISIRSWPSLIFHLAFVLLILGAAVTRYIGFEGNMHIREGESSNIMFSAEPYLLISAETAKQSVNYQQKIQLSPYIDNDFHVKLHPEGVPQVDVKYKQYLMNAVEKLVENTNGGSNYLEMVYAVEGRQHTLWIKEGETSFVGNLAFSYNAKPDSNALQIRQEGGRVTITSPSPMLQMEMSGVITDTIGAKEIAQMTNNRVFNAQGVSFLYKKAYINASKQLVQGTEEEEGSPALLVAVEHSGKTQELVIWGGAGYKALYKEAKFDGVTVKVAYGDREIQLPFALKLDDFILDRYAGSMSPSSYASEVSLIDVEKNINEKHRIFMNNVLDYRGYRFFQSSYDTDEGGTILSVNHDFWGTWLSYIGYALLGVGFTLTLFNRLSRFRACSRYISELRSKRKAVVNTTVVMLLMFLGSGVFAQGTTVQPPVSAEHANKFGKMLVQTFDGRFQPIQTLAYDVLHKVSRQDNFNLPGKGDMNGVQVLMDMLIDGEYWKNQKIIYIREKGVRDMLGITGSKASLLDFYDQQQNYKLAKFAETSFRKKQAEQNAFDKEIIKLDERINVFMSALNGSIYKIFPLKDSPNHKWISPSDSMAFAPLTGEITAFQGELQLEHFSYSEILRKYFTVALESTKSGNYAEPDKILSIMETIQRQYTPKDILPSDKMISLETYYNDAQIFIKLRNWYAILSLILLVLAFVENLKSDRSKFLDIAMKIFIGVLAFAFAYHTFGMGLRWYLSGHAPWSNGYEALLLMAWGSLLAGFSFTRYSRITLAATVLLAASMLMTASHSSYDPQLTNLQPVLKSYWLIIHVAVITISYGFLGLGFVLGLFNMFLSLFKTRNNMDKLTMLGQELTYINEMNITIGLFLATLGTFLGGVWANESWGRYWGWDAKETWALVIVIVYAAILHLRLIPKMKSAFTFNVGSILGFGSVLMTFVGVNYYLSKGLHSYAADDNKVFPIWAWGMILGILLIIVLAGLKERSLRREREAGA